MTAGLLVIKSNFGSNDFSNFGFCSSSGSFSPNRGPDLYPHGVAEGVMRVWLSSSRVQWIWRRLANKTCSLPQ